MGSITYENNALKRILIDGGYIEGGVYYFYLTDHLGNNRIVANASGTVIQKTHYYPFGAAFAEGTKAEQSKQPYKYGDKLLDDTHGLNVYDFEARYSDPALANRFWMVDPLAEKYYSISPYVYCNNNPIKFIDPTGMDVWSTNDPFQIARFLDHMQAVAGNKTSDPFDYSGWERMTDNDYKEHNKDNSISFNDDSFDFNINLEDYQGSFKAGMRSKKTKLAYITASDLEALSIQGENIELDIALGLDEFALTVGSGTELLFGPYLHKNSGLARTLYPPSRVIKTMGDVKKYTSVNSAFWRGYYLRKKTGGAAGRIMTNRVAWVVRPIFGATAIYGSWSVFRKLGYWYGGDAVVRKYRQNNK